MSAASKKNLSNPDETRDIPLAQMVVVTVGDMTLGKATMQPGWRWSEHVKPVAQTESCMLPHRGFVASGRLLVKMDDGTELELGPGDAYNIGPGHDAWVLGDEVFVGYDFASAATYAKPA